MSIWVNCPPYIAYHFASQVMAFKEIETQIVAEVSPLFACETKTAQLAATTFENPQIPDDIRKTPVKAVQWLLQKDYVPSLQGKNIVFLSSIQAADAQTAIRLTEFYYDHTIERFRLLILDDDTQETRNLTCPITHELLKEPVIDNHGHTFEKSAIEEHMKRSKSCPLNREPINSLNPNLAIKDQVDRLRASSPIPLLPIMENRAIVENREKADLFIKTAQTFVEGKEYQTAIQMFEKAFAYTNNSEDFAHLPPLFMKLEQTHKAALAYIYLAKRRLEESQKSRQMSNTEGKAILNSLSKAIELFPKEEVLLALDASFAMATENYLTASKTFSALALQQEATESGKSAALRYWEHVLACNPTPTNDIYEHIAPYCDNSLKVRLFLTGFLYYYRSSPKISLDFYERARLLDPKNPLIYLARLSRLEENHPDYVSLCRTLCDLFEKKEDLPSSLNYAQIASRSNEPQDLRKHIALLLKTKELQEAESIYLKLINLLYPQGEDVISEACTFLGRKAPFLEALLKIYINQDNHAALEKLLAELANLYESEKNLPQAERIYRIAYEKFRHFESSFKLASIIAQTKCAEGIHLFCELSTTAYSNKQFDKVALCIEQIKKFDPSSTTLTQPEQQYLLTQSYVTELFQKLESTQNELQAIQIAKQAKKAAKEQGEGKRARAKARIEQMRLKLPQCAFGKQKWEEYFGDVGVEPALPPNILEILSSPCPFWPGKKVQETHLLVLIPEKVNGTPLTLKSLGELVQHNLKGTSSKYSGFVIGEYTDSPNPSTHWTLMTRDVLPESRNKNYETQKNLVAQYAQKANIPYQVPSVLDATTCIFMEHVHSGIRLYSDDPWTYTRCQEKFNKNWQLVVGGFAPAGLCLNSHGYDLTSVGVAALRKF